MLALTHHVIVQVAARRVGITSWFREYAVLGDDIIIMNDSVAQSYLSLMTYLGVEINPIKGMISNTTFEFAKILIHVHKGDLSPIGPGLILQMCRNVRLFPLLVREALLKGYSLSPEAVIRAISLISKIRRCPIKEHEMIASVALSPTGGGWQGGHTRDFSRF